MLAALLSTWITTVLNSYQTKFGKGASLSQVEKDPNSPRIQAALSGILVTWFIYRPLYIFTLSLVKLSILTFYRTLVPPSPLFRSFRYTVYVLIIFTILHSLSMTAVSIFQCTPVSAAYSVSSSFSQILGQSRFPQPRCYKPNIIWVSNAIINFATDIAIFLLPIPIIASLGSMTFRKRLQLFCVLSIGTLAIAASGVRMWILVLWAKDVRSRNKFGTDLLTWGQVEELL
ncbi:hypothetical protein BU24DRAFT_463447 [Aaosphaeria arxii CBS 175.79]|uniref:Rhodopsin domain-containing protein n=1 Tax=Aaosphaeria arxii CBS 175.79 TaxID=1450172 RepID=A0A6A5XPM9_9PLEO|nr:uncharacterized protein BU24DRAFT_463447 [Aaosphaeria arxii CBS 175.79]KAF2014680.1 hypothetical protein BU24DRAFT_463447 [Aaosphaeria arxii CBS 175.79]